MRVFEPTGCMTHDAEVRLDQLMTESAELARNLVTVYLENEWTAEQRNAITRVLSYLFDGMPIRESVTGEYEVAIRADRYNEKGKPICCGISRRGRVFNADHEQLHYIQETIEYVIDAVLSGNTDVSAICKAADMYHEQLLIDNIIAEE